MKNRLIVLTVAIALLGVLLLGCTMGRGGLANATATPTKTPRPLFTSTPTPTDTPPPTPTLVPTFTSIPPTATPLPTDTTVPPTEAPPTEAPATEAPPTDTPIPPTATVAAPTEPPPTNAPKPKSTSTPAPPTNTPKPQVDFVIKEIVPFVDGSTGQSGFHNIYFTVIDAGGQPLDNIILASPDTQPEIQVITGSKGPGKAEFTMVYAEYYFQVTGDTSGQTYASEVTHRLSMIPGNYWWPDAIAAGICSDEAACREFGAMHFSYNITFQRTW